MPTPTPIPIESSARWSYRHFNMPVRSSTSLNIFHLNFPINNLINNSIIKILKVEVFLSFFVWETYLGDFEVMRSLSVSVVCMYDEKDWL